jgi:hypothetical protein
MIYKETLSIIVQNTKVGISNRRELVKDLQFANRFRCAS